MPLNCITIWNVTFWNVFNKAAIKRLNADRISCIWLVIESEKISKVLGQYGTDFLEPCPHLKFTENPHSCLCKCVNDQTAISGEV